MKKNVYLIILTVITIICIIGGTSYHLIAGSGNSLGQSFKNTGVFSGMFTDSETLSLDAFTSIQIDADVMSLTIRQGSDYSIQYSASEGLEPVYSIKNGELVIKQRYPNGSFWDKLRFLNKGKCSVTITVPFSETLDRLEANSDIGDFTVEGLSISTLSLSADVGDIYVSSCTLGEDNEISADVGNVELKDCTFTSLSVEADVGDVSVNSGLDLSDYNMELSADMGKISVSGINYGAKYKQKGVGVYSLEIEASVGHIEVY
jgi:hypothetical protein